MKNNQTIRQFLAALFLLLFSFCVTPKRFLHDFLANHKDTQSVSGLPFHQISSSGFHCHTDDLVVVAPFIPEGEPSGYNADTSLLLHFSEPLSCFLSIPVNHSDSRGPPAMFCA